MLGKLNIRNGMVGLFCLFFLNSAFAQENPDNTKAQKNASQTLILTHETDAIRAESDLVFRQIRIPNAPITSLHVKYRDLENDVEALPHEILAEVALDFPIEDINWLSILPASEVAELLDGMSINGTMDEKFVIFNSAPEALGTIEEIVEASAPEPEDTGEDLAPLLDISIFEPEPLGDIVISEQPERVVSIIRDSLWRLYPQKLLDQLEHMGVQRVIISVPSSLNGTYPSNPIELKRFIALASQKHISVWANIAEDFQPLDNGASKSQTMLREFANYNQYSSAAEQLDGVQVNVGWLSMETYHFYEDLWIDRAVDLYASLDAEIENLNIDLLLSEEMLSKLYDDSVFEPIALVADSVTVLMRQEQEQTIHQMLAPLAVWAQERQKEYRVALEKTDQEVVVAGWLRPDNDGNVRLINLGQWAVLIKVKEESSTLGSGFIFEEAVLSSFADGDVSSSKLFYTSDMLDLAYGIEQGQADSEMFRGVMLFSLPEFEN